MAGGAQPGLPLAVFAENIKIAGNGNAAENQPALVVVDRSSRYRKYSSSS